MHTIEPGYNRIQRRKKTLHNEMKKVHLKRFFTPNSDKEGFRHDGYLNKMVEKIFHDPSPPLNE